MSIDLRELYQSEILSHSKRPHNARTMDDATSRAEGYNSLCGDKMMVYVKVDDGVVSDVSFESKACAICTASASMMTQAVKGRKVAEAIAILNRFVNVATGRPGSVEAAETLGRLAVLSGVSQYPARVKCATLPWRALEAALAGAPETPVSSTEDHSTE